MEYAETTEEGEPEGFPANVTGILPKDGINSRIDSTYDPTNSSLRPSFAADNKTEELNSKLELE